MTHTKHDPRIHNKQLGQVGEEHASQYLIQQGYTIIQRNWRTKLGEIDIIAIHDNILFLVEVKTRSSINFGYPVEAITQKKLQRMKLTAQLYCQAHNYYGHCKLVVIEVIQGSCHLIEIE